MRPLRTILILAALAAAVLGGASAPARAAPRLTVFGDSYSIPVHDGARDWPLLLHEEGLVGRIDDFARFGATASSGWHINFAQQLQRWRRAGRPLGVTVVYLGFNDVGVNLARSRADYAAGIDELVAAGATSGGNRLLLVEPHDVGSTPLNNRTAKRGFLRRQTEDWDGFVAFTAHHARRDAGGRVRGDRPGAGAPGPVRVHERDHGRPRARGDDGALRRRLPRRPARAGDHRRHDRRPPALAGSALFGQGKGRPSRPMTEAPPGVETGGAKRNVKRPVLPTADSVPGCAATPPAGSPRGMSPDGNSAVMSDVGGSSPDKRKAAPREAARSMEFHLPGPRIATGSAPDKAHPGRKKRRPPTRDGPSYGF